MAHTIENFLFETEVDAHNFAKKIIEIKDPIEDVYVRGPFLVDEKVVSKNIPCDVPKAKWWQVTVETFR